MTLTELLAEKAELIFPRFAEAEAWALGSALVARASAGALPVVINIRTANRTANHRLGLLALQRLDFSGAAIFLEKAHQVDSGHRGISKALGLTYVWLGQYEQARALLRDIPEAGRELDTYSWWWTTQNRPDLAEKAADMVKKLQ